MTHLGLRRIFKTKKGFGLIEALLAIAIFGTAIIVATAVTINSLKRVKDTETADFATSIMIRSSELTKQMPAAQLEALLTGPSPWTFSVSGDITNPNTTIGSVNLVRTNGITQKIDVGSSFLNSYRVNISDPDLQTLQLYNQVFIEPVGTEGNLYISSRIVYRTGDNSDWFVAELQGFKILSN